MGRTDNFGPLTRAGGHDHTRRQPTCSSDGECFLHSHAHEGPPAQYFPSQQPFTRGPPFSVLLLSIFPLKVLFLRALRLNIFPLSILSLRALLFSVLQLSTFPTKVLFLRALLLRFKSASLSLLAMSSLVCSRFLSASCGLRSSTRSASRGKSVMEDVCSGGKRLRARTKFFLLQTSNRRLLCFAREYSAYPFHLYSMLVWIVSYARRDSESISEHLMPTLLSTPSLISH